MSQNDPLPLGPVMLDVAGIELTPEDRERLRHPATGGVILFARNAGTPTQIQALVAAIRAERPGILIAVDQEGGRVQRLREGFTAIPPMRQLGHVYDYDRNKACELAHATGELLARELRALDIDFSFTPVLDRDLEISDVIGDRAFHYDPDVIARLAGELIRGLAAAGMAAVGKHFPGHGAVKADSHVALPVDDRPLSEIENQDLEAFRPVLGDLEGIMPAHVLYPQVDGYPAGFSRVWLQDILRRELRYRGAILSDDLAMAGAEGIGDPAERAAAARAAGCDMVLICNEPEQADRILEAQVDQPLSAESARRLERLRARPVDADPNRLPALRAQLDRWLRASQLATA
ncbi:MULTISPECIES: beta-N-acetylhexosaminidase [unclassified Thioalkalivibrio]|uniref:beta-N-acetylhexosaminidase n=1 Tax=unclassified Thioalkalivibrio TaxID=2621013 RepID=UPI000374C624|nr:MULTISPECIES: beta-N-acetylhexosaminidase [unclassified Thioalkalivibrio]